MTDEADDDQQKQSADKAEDANGQKKADEKKDGDKKEGEKKKPRSKLPIIIAVILLVIAIIGGIIYWLLTMGEVSTDDAYTDGRAISTATNTSGFVTALNVNDNQFVHKGDLLLIVDPRANQAQVEQAQANLKLAQANLVASEIDLQEEQVRAPAQLLQAQAQLSQARAQYADADRNYRRQLNVDQRATAQSDIDQTTQQLVTAKAQVQQAQANLSIASLVQQNIQTAQQEVAQRQAQLAQAQASLDNARTQLSYNYIRAPQDGWITMRNVELGTYLQAGTQVFDIVANQVWITANFKETQLDGMRVGQHVTISVDAFPALKLRGHVDSMEQGSGAVFSALPGGKRDGEFRENRPARAGENPHRFRPAGLPADIAAGHLRGTDGPRTVSESGDQKGGNSHGHNPWAIALTVTLAAFMEVLDTTIVNVALPHIAGSLAVSSDDATWALTTYLVANGIILTISGSLSRMFGRKRFFLICIGVFTIASFGCGISTSFTELLLFRAIQGFFGGGLQPLQQAIILDAFPPEKRSQAFSLSAIAIVVAPVLGPLAGGWLTDNFSWHLIFLVNVPVGIITLLGVMHFVEDSEEVRREQASAPPFDYIGTGFIALALGCLQIGVDRGEDYDWFGSSFICILLGTSLLAFIFGSLYLLYAKNPVVDLRVLKDRNFVAGFVQIGIMGLVLYSSAVIIPQFAQQQLGYTSTWAGLVLAPGAIVLMMFIPLVARAMGFIPPKYLIAVGGLTLGASLFYSMHLVPQEDFYHLVILRASQTIGLSFLFVPISTVAYVTLPHDKQGDAAALFSMSRNIFGGIGISITTAIITERSQVHQSYLVDHLSGGGNYQLLLSQVAKGMAMHGTPFAKALIEAPNNVFTTLQAQDAVLAYADVFWYTGLLALVLIPTALMMSSKSGGGESAPA